VADAQQPFCRALADPFEILRQRGNLRFMGHQAPVFFPKGSFAGGTAPALVAVPGGSILNTLGGVTVRAVHTQILSATAHNINTYLAIPNLSKREKTRR
jgi:hypothetical protein